MKDYLICDLDSLDGERATKVHVFIQFNSGNKSLCGGIIAGDEEEKPMKWEEFTDRKELPAKSITCKKCFKMFSKFLEGLN